ncbi:MAG: acyltransferase [Acidiferrobacteraceae bacterium]
MRHRIFHSYSLRDRLDDLARELRTDRSSLEAAYVFLLKSDILFEEDGGTDGVRVSLSSIRAEKRISEPLARCLYLRLRADIPCKLIPPYGITLETLHDRLLRLLEHLYNMVINKVPSHTIRIAWLRMGGAIIGKGSTIWRNTEVLGVENLRMGEDSLIAWHCQVDARAGLVIGDHVCVASHVLIIAGSHDLGAPEFWSISAPIYIHDYAWIASRAIITAGAIIGHGAVVAANTIVSKEIAPYKIVGGSGAKPMGERPHDLTYRVGGKGLLNLLH